MSNPTDHSPDSLSPLSDDAKKLLTVAKLAENHLGEWDQYLQTTYGPGLNSYWLLNHTIDSVVQILFSLQQNRETVMATVMKSLAARVNIDGPYLSFAAPSKDDYLGARQYLFNRIRNLPLTSLTPPPPAPPTSALYVRLKALLDEMVQKNYPVHILYKKPGEKMIYIRYVWGCYRCLVHLQAKDDNMLSVQLVQEYLSSPTPDAVTVLFHPAKVTISHLINLLASVIRDNYPDDFPRSPRDPKK